MGKLIDNDTKKIIGGVGLIVGGALLLETGNPMGAQMILAGVGLLMMAAETGENLPSAAIIQDMRSLTISHRSTTSPWKAIYGKCRVGGPIVYINLTGDDLEFLNIVMVLAPHKIVDVCESGEVAGKFYPSYIYFNDLRVPIDPATGNALTNQMRAGFPFPKVYDPFSVSFTSSEINIGSDTINPRVDGVNTAIFHYITHNQRVRFTTTGVAPSPLVEGRVYFASVDNTNTIKLMERFDAGNPQIIDLTTGGSGTHSLQLDEFQQTTDYLGHVFVEFKKGSPNQNVLPSLKAEINDSDKWGDDHRLRGRAYAYIRLKWNPEVFSSGRPNISFDVKGKELWDPRLGLDPDNDAHVVGDVRQNNAALIALDYMNNGSTSDQKATGTYGLGISRDDIDTDSFITAANVCDGDVNLKDGGDENRYEAHGSISTTRTPKTNIESILSSMRGRIIYLGGKWKIYAAEYQAPYATPFTESDLLGTPKIQSMISRRENFNAVKGIFRSPWTGFISGQYPDVVNSTYETEDGEIRVYGELNLPMVISPSQAQRLGKIHLENIRRKVSMSIRGKLSFFIMEPGESLLFTMSSLEDATLTSANQPWTDKEFEVLSGSLNIGSDGNLGYVIQMKEIDSTVFAWDENTDEGDMAVGTASTALSSLAFGADADSSLVSSVTLTSGTAELFIRLDGTVFSRLKVSWTLPGNIYIKEGGRIEIQFKKSSASAWEDAGIIPGNQTEFFILDVEDDPASDNVYDVRVRTINSIGARSNWVVEEGHAVSGKLVPPSDVTGFVATIVRGGIKLAWNEIPDIDRSVYEVQQGTVWDASGNEVKDKLRGLNIRDASPNAAGVASDYMIKAIDTSGLFSDNEATAQETIPVPTTPTSFAGTIERGGIRLRWTASTDLNHSHYAIKKGASWVAGTFLDATRETTEYFDEGVLLGNNVYHIRDVDVFGNESTEASDTVNYVAPADVATFIAVQNAGVLLLQWSDVEFLNLDGYIIKYGPPGSVVWDTGVPITNINPGTSETTAVLPPGTHRILIKAVDVFGFESVNAITKDVIIQQINAIFSDVDHAPAWGGILTNLHHHYTNRLAIADQTAATGDNFDVFDTYIQNPFATSTYETVEYDLGVNGPFSVRISHTLDAILHVDEASGIVVASMEVNIDPDGLGFDGWEPFNTGLRTVQKVKFRFVLDNTQGESVVNDYNTIIDQPSISERDQGVSISASGTSIAFVNPFLELPIVTISVEQVSGGEKLFAGWRDKTVLGFDIFIFNEDGIAKAGTVDWEAHNL